MRTLSAPTEYVKSEDVGHRTFEPLDSLIGGSECCVRIGFLRTPFHHSPLHCSTGMRLVVMSVQDELIVFIW